MGASSALDYSWTHLISICVIIFSLAAGVVRTVFLDRSDPSHCISLLTQGSWLNFGQRNWQPDGCMLFPYRETHASACLNSKPVIFIGDSVTRMLFFQFIRIVDPKLPIPVLNRSTKHSDHVLHASSGSKLSFHWDPFLNSSYPFDMLRGANNPRPPALLVLGSGLWYLRHSNTSGGLRAWEANTERIFGILAQDGPRLADQVIMLPVEQVVPSKLSEDRASSIQPPDIAAMNADLYHRISRTLFDITSVSSSSVSPSVAFPIVFNRMLDASQTSDGMHFSDSLVGVQANILLNLRCNDLLPKKFPLDKTCCNSYPWPSLLHFVILGVSIAWGPFLYLLSSRTVPTDRRASWVTETHYSALSFSGGLALIFLADRTGFWLKEQKQFDPWTFFALCLGSLGAGLLSIKRSDKDLGFLNREQTDEWKGWMQLAILIYHYCGASKISGIYNPIRVLVASYLFMTGYGHTSFYLKKADFGFSRIAQILIRLNLLTVFLAYTMNTDYISYYFSPLVSIWYLIVYATMAIAPSFNNRADFFVCKIITSASLITLFMKQDWLLQGLFDFLNQIANVHWSAREWAFRFNLDLWIVYVGMLAAATVAKVHEYRLTDHAYWPVVVKASLGASVISLIWFFVFELYQESKFTYNLWHPFISFIPVLAFTILRNGTVVLRSASSSAFAFIGRCSLETFIIQYHFWLAADTKGILLVLPGTQWRPVNFVLTTTMFIFVSDQMAQSTAHLTSWICGGPPKQPSSLPVTTSVANDIIGNQTIPREPDTPIRPSPRWVERLAKESLARRLREWLTPETGRYGLGTRLAFGMGVLWLLNLLW